MRKNSLPFYTSAFLAAALASSTAPADDTKDPMRKDQTAGMQAQDRANATMQPEEREDRREEARDAQELVQEATQVVSKMKRDPQLVSLLEQAHGVLIVPEFARAAAIVGGSGGEGVLLMRGQNQWNGPVFYDIGSISIGAQAGGEGGSIALLLMNDRAVQSFKQNKNNFSLDAKAGLTVVDYSAASEATLGKGDVVAWSGTEGLFAGASLAVTDVRRDDEENAAYYEQQATPQQIFAGSVKNPQAEDLRKALPQVAAR